MIDEPTYRGCARYAYGPDDVTSRDLFRCPAAQMRTPSPIRPTAPPTTSDSFDGLARISTSGANTQPSATRKRASSSISETAGSRTRRPGCEPPLHRAGDLGDLDVEQAHPIQLTPAQVMALADRVARHRHVAGRHRAVARWAGRTVNPDQRCADGGRDVRRPRVARDHDRR